jgi:hypothetical protein
MQQRLKVWCYNAGVCLMCVTACIAIWLNNAPFSNVPMVRAARSGYHGAHVLPGLVGLVLWQ